MTYITTLFRLAAFDWMFLMVASITRMIVSVNSHVPSFRHASLIIWSAAASVVAAAVIASNLAGYQYNTGGCWLSADFTLMYFFLVPVCAVIAVNFALFSVAVVSLIRHKKELSILNNTPQSQTSHQVILCNNISLSLVTISERGWHPGAQDLHVCARIFLLLGGNWVLGFLSLAPRLSWLAPAFTTLSALQVAPAACSQSATYLI